MEESQTSLPIWRRCKNRARDVSIAVWASGGKRVNDLLRPGTTFAGAVILAAGVLALMKTQNFPDAEIWERGKALNAALAVSTGFSMVFTFLIVIGYRRRLRKSMEEDVFYSACRTVCDLIQAETGTDYRHLGVHIWTVTGFRGGRHLVNRATFKTQRHRDPPIRWTRGKGAIGRCWETGCEALDDAEALGGLTEHQFLVLDPEDRFQMTWQEFQHTREYMAIWVSPIFKGPAGNRKVGGCLSVDIVEQEMAAALLDAATRAKKRDLADVLAVCNDVLP